MTGFQHAFPLQFLTVSQIITASRCLRRFFYQVACRLERPEGPHVALKFGEAIHAGIPYAIQEGDEKKAFQAFMSVWAGSQEDEKHNPIVATMMLGDLKESHFGRKSLFELIKPPEKLRSIGTTVSEYEYPFALNIPGLDIPIFGRIDGLARHRDTGQHWVVEYKTSSENSERLPKQFQINPQVLTYVMAAKTYFPELDIQGCFVETILKSKTRVGCTIHPIITPNFMLEYNLNWLIMKGNEILRCWKAQEFPQEPTGCAPYAMFGMPGYQCDYANLCSVADWTSLRQFYVAGEQHLPFEIPRITTTEQVKPAEVAPEVVSKALNELAITEESAGSKVFDPQFIQLGGVK